jgi:uncharacterized protein (UPF0335 family)
MEEKDMLVDNFLNSKKEFLEIKTDELLMALISLEMEKKEIDAEIKKVKLIAKDDGVDVNAVSKVFSKIKSRLKTKDEELSKEDILEDHILNSENIINEISELVRPIVVTIDED